MIKKTFTTYFFLLLSIGLFAKDIDSQLIAKDSTPPILTFEQLKPYLTTKSDSVFVINFWATWCAPCVAEMPYFEKLNADFSPKKVKVILVNLDLKSQIATKVLPFLEKNRLKSKVVVLSEKNANNWIPKVHPEWAGSIPATLIFDKNKRVFFEQSFDQYADLKKVISRFVGK